MRVLILNFKKLSVTIFSTTLLGLFLTGCTPISGGYVTKVDPPGSTSMR